MTGTALRAFIPAGLTVISMSNGGVETTPGEIDWDVGSLAVGASVHRTLQVMANGTVPAGGALQARAILSHDGGLETDGTADYTVPLVAAAQPLLVDVGVASGPALSGGRLLYTMTVSNVSMQDVLGVRSSSPVPEGLQFNGAGDADPDGNCFNNACNSDVEATWSLGTVAAGASVSIAVDMSVATTVVDGTLFSARPIFRATGLNPIIVTKTVAAFGEPKAQLAIGTATNPVVPGGAFAYSLDIGQIGATPLTGTTLRVFLPPGVTATTVSDGGTAASTGEVDWSLGTVAVGGSDRSLCPGDVGQLPPGGGAARRPRDVVLRRWPGSRRDERRDRLGGWIDSRLGSNHHGHAQSDHPRDAAALYTRHHQRLGTARRMASLSCYPFPRDSAVQRVVRRQPGRRVLQQCL